MTDTEKGFFRDDSSRLHTPLSYLPETRDSRGEQIHGHVATRLGVVAVDHWRRDDGRGHVVFSFAYKGRYYERRRPGSFTRTGLVTMAGRFARDVVAGRVK